MSNPAKAVRNVGRRRRIVIHDSPAWNPSRLSFSNSVAIAVQRRSPLLVVVPQVLGVGGRPRRSAPARRRRRRSTPRHAADDAAGAEANSASVSGRAEAGRADAGTLWAMPSCVEQPRLGRDALAAAVAGDASVAAEHAVARHDDRDRVRADRPADGAPGGRTAGRHGRVRRTRRPRPSRGRRAAPTPRAGTRCRRARRAGRSRGGGRRSTRSSCATARSSIGSERSGSSSWGSDAVTLDGERDDGLAVADDLDAADRARHAAKEEGASVTVCMLRE